MLASGWIRIQSDWNAGIFGTGSLLEKTLSATLDPEQAARWQAAVRQRNRQRYEQAVRLAVTRLRRTLDLSVPQVQALSRLILTETRPPRRFGMRSEIEVVFCQMSRLPARKLKPVFDETQWLSLMRILIDYTPGSSAYTTLQQNGFVLENNPSDAPSELAAKTAAPGPAAPGRRAETGDRTAKP